MVAYPDFEWFAGQGKIRIFYQNLAFEAEEMHWSQKQGILELRQKVRLDGPNYQLQAEALRLHLPSQTLDLRWVELDYKNFRLQAEQAQLRPKFMQFWQVVLSHPDWPGEVQAEIAQLSLAEERETLNLENLNWLGIPWPQLQLNLQSPSSALRLRPQNQLLTPTFQWETEGLVSDNLLRLLDHPNGQAFGRLRWHPRLGWGSGLLYEWRPESAGIFNGNFLWGEKGAQGKQEWFYEWEKQGWLRTGLLWQDNFSLNQNLLLPLLTQDEAPLALGLHAVFQSQWFHQGPIIWRYLLGGAWTAQALQGGGSLQMTTPAIPVGAGFHFYPSLLANLQFPLASTTLGGRLLVEQSPSDSPLTWGHYFDTYMSSLKASAFAQPQILTPRIGHYFFWTWTPEIATGLVGEWMPSRLEMAKLDGLLTFQLAPLTLNLWIQSLPWGLQLQSHLNYF